MKIIFFWILVITGVLVLGIIWWRFVQAPARLGVYDEFAKCLAEKQITMYGAAWCSHCQNEKKAFGLSFQYVPYVECPQNSQLCLEKKIEGYPTWIFPDGKVLTGEQGVGKLSEASGCALPK